MTGRLPPFASRADEALALADETLAMLELEESRLTPIVQRCLRLARLTGSDVAEAWFRCELNGYREEIASPHGDQLWSFAAWSGRHAPRQLNEPSDAPQRWWIGPIGVIESSLEVARSQLHAYTMPIVSVTESGAPRPFVGTASESLLASVTVQRNIAVGEIQRWTAITAVLRGSLQQWLASEVIRRRYGAVMDTAFERARASFDDLLGVQAPEAARALAAAFARATSNDTEEWSQSLTSCRRALKALADAVYPARSDRPHGRDLSSDAYKNRLIQFAKDQLSSSTSEAVVVSEIESLAARVDALNDIASKGVHRDVDVSTLDMAVVRTYLLAGELLTLAPGRAVAGIPDELEADASASGTPASETLDFQVPIRTAEPEARGADGSAAQRGRARRRSARGDSG